MNTNRIGLATDFPVEAPRAGARFLEFSAWLAWARNRLEAVRGLRQRRRAIAELSRMSDWSLQDMGIPRDQITEVVDGLIAREGPSVGHLAE
jgi:uncharacterized protein YjiS (DUF1127 family)